MSTNNKTTIYIVRHAESEHNINQIIGADPSLTQNGIKQAKHLSQVFSKIKFDCVFTSELSRTKDTAKLIIENRNIPFFASSAINERNYGIYEGMPISTFEKDLASTFAKMRTMSDEEVFTFRRYKSCETDEEMIRRFVGFLNNVGEKYSGKTLLIVTHGILMRVFLIYLKLFTYKKLAPYAIKNTGYIRIELSKGNYVIKELAYN